MSPVVAAIALAKLCAGPSGVPVVSWMRTGNGAISANFRSRVNVPSVEPSSHTTTSSGRRD
jgi:hypothetical protein